MNFISPKVTAGNQLGPIAAKLATLARPTNLIAAEAELTELREQRTSIMSRYDQVCACIRARSASSSDLPPITKEIAAIDKKIGAARDALKAERAKFQARVDEAVNPGVAEHVAGIKDMLNGLEPDLKAYFGVCQRSGLSVSNSTATLWQCLNELRFRVGK